MHDRPDIPDLATFLSAPAATVAAVAPRTVMFAAGGTRRDAVLHGLAVDRFSEELARFSIQRFTDTAGRFFKLGAQYYDFKYTGSNNWVGAPVEISQLMASPFNAQMFAPVKSAHDLYGTFEVKF